MEIKNYGAMRLILWIAQGFAIAALWAGAGRAFATPLFITAHFGEQHRYESPYSPPPYQDSGSTPGQSAGADSGDGKYSPGDGDHGGGYGDYGAGDGDQNGWSGENGDQSRWDDSGTPGSDEQGTPTAVPEPGTLALFFAGIGGLGIALTRRRTGRGAPRRAAG